MHGGSDTTGAVRAVESVTTGLAWQRAAPVVSVAGGPGKADLEACWELGATARRRADGLTGPARASERVEGPGRGEAGRGSFLTVCPPAPASGHFPDGMLTACAGGGGGMLTCPPRVRRRPVTETGAGPCPPVGRQQE